VKVCCACEVCEREAKGAEERSDESGGLAYRIEQYLAASGGERSELPRAMNIILSRQLLRFDLLVALCSSLCLQPSAYRIQQYWAGRYAGCLRFATCTLLVCTSLLVAPPYLSLNSPRSPARIVTPKACFPPPEPGHGRKPCGHQQRRFPSLNS